jgi:hypothetical protein
MLKKYLMGLALSGLVSRIGKNTRSVLPRSKNATTPKKMATFLLGAGVGAGIAYALSQKRDRH